MTVTKVKKKPVVKVATTVLPKQARAKKNYEAMIFAAQEILEKSGLEALNSNAIAAQAGVTTPVFYRYFKNKHELLSVLGKRLTESQTQAYRESLQEMDENSSSLEDLGTLALALLTHTYTITSNMVGARAILISLRAVPSLSAVRVGANQKLARAAAKRLLGLRSDLSKVEAYERCRLATEMGDSVIELLLGEPKLSSERTLAHTADLIMTLYTE